MRQGAISKHLSCGTPVVWKPLTTLSAPPPSQQLRRAKEPTSSKNTSTRTSIQRHWSGGHESQHTPWLPRYLPLPPPTCPAAPHLHNVRPVQLRQVAGRRPVPGAPAALAPRVGLPVVRPAAHAAVRGRHTRVAAAARRYVEHAAVAQRQRHLKAG